MVVDSEEDRAAAEQVVTAVAVSVVDIAEAHAEVWAEWVDQEAPCIMAHIGTALVGTDLDQYLYLDHQDIMARVVETALITKKIAVASVAL